jgi:hypothetical protein
MCKVLGLIPLGTRKEGKKEREKGKEGGREKGKIFVLRIKIIMIYNLQYSLHIKFHMQFHITCDIKLNIVPFGLSAVLFHPSPPGLPSSGARPKFAQSEVLTGVQSAELWSHAVPHA